MYKEGAENKNFEETEREGSYNLLTQLKEKLKNQAQKIRNLESYKLLCEERIKDFAPFHPFPISREHIGQNSNSSIEIVNLRQKVSKLENQLLKSSENNYKSPGDQNILLEKYYTSLKEKDELEESLRNEMRTCEEQRTYIEVLRQTIEINMESFGIKGIPVDQFGNFASVSIALDQCQKDLQKKTEILKSYELEIQDFRESLEYKENECEELRVLQKKAYKDIEVYYESLSSLQEEIQRLEEEKSSLIEYIETQTSSEQHFNQELAELKSLMMKKENENKNLFKENKKLLEENKTLKQDLENIKNQENNLVKNFKESQQSFISLKSRVEEKDRIITKQNNDLERLADVKAKLVAEVQIYEENLAKIQDELNFTEDKLQNLKNEKDKIEESFFANKLDLQNLQNKFNVIEKNFKNTEAENKNFDIIIKNLSEKLKNSDNQIENLNTLLIDEKNNYKKSQTIETLQNQKITELEAKNSNLLTETLTIESQNSYLTNELKHLKQQNEQLNFVFESLSTEKQQLELSQGRLRSLLENEQKVSKSL